MSRQLPVLEYGETLFLDNSEFTWRDVPVPSCLVVGKKWLGRKIIGIDPEIPENHEFLEFLWTCFKNNIPNDFTEKFLREEIGIRLDVYSALDSADRQRMDEIRVFRKRKLMDDIEQAKQYDGIPRTPDEIAYANAVNKAKLMIVSRTQREYNIQQEQKVEVTGNLAKIVIEPKEEK